MLDLRQCALGIEFGSTRIKAVLVDGSYAPVAQGDFTWENQLKDGVWTYPLEAVHTGLQHAYAALAADVQAKYGQPLTTVGCIGISAMMHGYLAFDGAGQLLVPFRTWRNTMTGPAAAELMGRLSEEQDASERVRSQLAFALLCELSDADSAAPALPPLVAAAIEDIRRNYAGLYGVEELSERLGVSKSHLVRAFTAALGVSPGRYLTSVRIEAAMRLLLHREYTLDVIASLCGFSGANYLCRVFKKTTGQSPTQWRAMAGRSALPELSPEQQRLEQELFI